jgi:nucleoside-triphosphatase
VRLGFRLVTLDGRSAVLAHTDIHSPLKVSQYGVDLEVLERLGFPALYEASVFQKLVVIDEIGKMELFSNKFKAAVLEILGRGKKVLGTIILTPDFWADALKSQLGSQGDYGHQKQPRTGVGICQGADQGVRTG